MLSRRFTPRTDLAPGDSMSRNRLAFVFAAALLAIAGSSGSAWAAKAQADTPPSLPPAANKKIDFVHDIRPIFQRTCYRCHGPETQKSSYRLDVRTVAMTKGDAYAPDIIPGKATDSPLVRFVSGLDSDVTMPPEGKRLSAEDVGLLRAWVDQGAVWPDDAAGSVSNKLDWWSLKPLVQPAVPSGKPSLLAPGQWPGVSAPPNPIDAFIEQSLTEKKFPIAPEADRRTLIRRLYFDLTGLPPMPAEVAAFVADRAPAAYDHLVDRLLASPRYGERFARHWMDTAHFAETHGHDQDRVREYAWPYRDYLVCAFNSDMPYGKFLEEQVAGDVLYPKDSQATVALGFLAAGPWDESSLRDIQENTIDRQIARYIDRDDMVTNVMNNFASVTVQCARCHDHKFDPITQQDYYALQADFAGVDKATRLYDTDPKTGVRRRELIARRDVLDRNDAATTAYLLSPKVQTQVAAWERDLPLERTRWTVLAPQHAVSSGGATLTEQPDRSLFASGNRPDNDTYTITAQLPLGQMTAIRLELLTDNRLPHNGPGRAGNGNMHVSEFQVFAGDAHGQQLQIASAEADFEETGWTVAQTIDGADATSWGIYPQVGQSHTAVFELANRFAASASRQITIVIKQMQGSGHLIGRMRLSVSDIAMPPGLDVVPTDILAILGKPAARRSDGDRIALARYQQRAIVLRDLAALPKQSKVYAAASDFEPDGGHVPPHGCRPVEVLHRGDVLQPHGAAVPGALSCVTAIDARFKLAHPDDEAARRAALAHWLSARQNPLTWRSIVNRVWQYHFGHAIVDTPNDFGHMGALPTNPALLDWLAVWFRDHGQSIKALNRLIVTSRAYRRSSRIGDIGLAAGGSSKSPAIAASISAALATDADNRFLWHMNRQRLDAEELRDAVLAISGQLDLRMGGPSDRQFEMRPSATITPIVDYSKFNLDSEAGHRRSIYRFLYRTLPDPFMAALDCPSGDEITPVRTNSVTVQQALTLWDDSFMALECEHFAARLKKMDSTTRGEVEAAVRLVFNRPVRRDELAEFTAYADKHGLANLCRVLLNTNEFLFVN